MSDAQNPAAQPPAVVEGQPSTEPVAKPAETAAKPAPRAFVRKPAPVAQVLAAGAQPAIEPAKDAAKEDRRAAIGSRTISSLRNRLAETEKAASEAKAYRDELAQYAKKELDTAPENARKYVLAKHKDDPRAQLQALRELREAGFLEAPKVSPIAQAAANTAPPKSPAADTTDPDVATAEKHRALAENPSLYLVADQFFQRNAAAIKRGLAKLAAKN
jgi:hypothetical protein